MFIQYKSTHLHCTSPCSQGQNNALPFTNVCPRHRPTRIVPACACGVTPARRFLTYPPIVQTALHTTMVAFCHHPGPIDSLLFAVSLRKVRFCLLRGFGSSPALQPQHRLVLVPSSQAVAHPVRMGPAVLGTPPDKISLGIKVPTLLWFVGSS